MSHHGHAPQRRRRSAAAPQRRSADIGIVRGVPALAAAVAAFEAARDDVLELARRMRGAA